MSEQISTWITDVGNRFLATNSTVGVDVAANQRLLKKHDTFEHETVVRGGRVGVATTHLNRDVCV